MLGSLYLSATPPEFGPGAFIQWRDLISGDPAARETIQAASVEHGLHRVPAKRYFGIGDDGTVRTYITCGNPKRFCQNGIVYPRGNRTINSTIMIFTGYPDTLLPQWREMEARMSALLEATIVSRREVVATEPQ